MAKHLPELAWDTIEVNRTKSIRADSADYQLKVSFRNTGKLPTALRQAHLVKIVSEDMVFLEFDTAGTSPGKPSYKILEEARPTGEREMGDGFSDFERSGRQEPIFKTVPYTEGGSVTTAVFNIRLFKKDELPGKAVIHSTRGGLLKGRDFIIW